MTLLRPFSTLKALGPVEQPSGRIKHGLGVRTLGDHALADGTRRNDLGHRITYRRDKGSRVEWPTGEEYTRAALREKGKNDRTLFCQKRIRLRPAGLFDLTIDHDFGRRQPGQPQFPGNIGSRMFSAQVQKWPLVPAFPDQPYKIAGRPAGRNRIEPDRSRGIGRGIAHGETGQIPPRGLRREGRHTVPRGEYQRGKSCEVGQLAVGLDPHHGRDHRRHPGPESPANRVCEFLCSRLGPCDEYRGGHFLSGVVSADNRCYLPWDIPAMGGAMTRAFTILGLESSCDDTAAAVVRSEPGSPPEILASVIHGQTALHADYGGIVPEIAARAHAEKLDACVAAALDRAALPLSAMDAIAVTAGPGLIGGVISGVMCAKGLAVGAGLPLVGVNHLAGHALTPRLTDSIAYPYLMLLVSGGHCQFVIVRCCDDFTRLGGTIDDAPGEAFDKSARLLGLPQPGGPAVEAAAAQGDPARVDFPRPLLDRPGCDMSFSGLKTALLRARDTIVAEKTGLTRQDRADLCAGFQAAMRDVLAEKTSRALSLYLAEQPAQPVLAVAGGVAANTAIRAGLERIADAQGARFVAPPLALCTDNAAMIAYAGAELFAAGRRDDMSMVARPRWPLDRGAAPLVGGGRKGAKA